MKLKEMSRRIIAALITIAMITGLVALADKFQYDNALLIFQGFTLSTSADGNVQATVNLHLQDVKTSGVAFRLAYDERYLVPSSYDKNELYTIPTGQTSISIEESGQSSFFKINEVNFPDSNVLPDREFDAIYSADDSYGQCLECMIMVNQDESAVQAGGNIEQIETVDGNQFVINAENGLDLGTLSFRVTDPTGFAKLSNAELKNVLRIAELPAPDNEFPFQIFYIADTEADGGEATGDLEGAAYLDYTFDVENPISSVKPVAGDEIIVSAAEIYEQGGRNGTETDLYTYLNLHMKDVVISYADTTKIMDTVQWLPSNTTISPNSWDATGGDYTVTQYYMGINDDAHRIEAVIHVTPVTLVRYEAADEYLMLNATPTSKADLRLPKKAKAIFDAALPLNYEVKIQDNTWSPDPDTAMPSDWTVAQSFTATVNVPELPIWATVPSDVADTVTVVRAVTGQVAQLGAPDVSVVRDDTTVPPSLKITVNSLGTDPVPAGTEFDIRMPNGEIVDPALYDVDTASGTPVITLPKNGVTPATPNQEAQFKRLKQHINLGNGLGDFEIRAKDSTGVKLPSEWVKLNVAPRDNYYTESKEFDYRIGKVQEAGAISFPKNGIPSVFPTTIALPAGDSVATTYSGADGTEPGALRTVTVDSWAIVHEAASGGTEAVTNTSNLVVGETVTAVGTLATTSYTGYGAVTNNNNNYTITLIMSVSDDDATKTPDITVEPTEWDFGKLTVGYLSTQLVSKEFTIANGTVCAAAGLNVRIEGTNPEAFEVLANAPYRLEIGESGSFVIRTKLGLPVGIYEADVKLYANNGGNTALKTIPIKFEVTDIPMYQVTLTVTKEGTDPLGTAKSYESTGTTEVSSFEENQTVMIKAVPAADTEFVRWEVVDGSEPVTLSSDTTSEATFTMPAGEVKLNAVFTKKLAYDLRITDFAAFDGSADTANKYTQLYQKNGNVFVADSLNQNTLEYYMVVPSSVENTRFEFTLKTATLADGSAVAVNPVMVEYMDESNVLQGTGTRNVQTDVALQYYTEKNNLFTVEKRTMDNVVKITLMKDGDSSVQKTYVIHLYRKLSDAEIADFHPGNTPYGLIDANTIWDDTQKQAAKDAFDKHNTYDTYIPGNAGATTSVYYSSYAWGTANYDKNPNAVVVYQNGSNALKIPGIGAFKNSVGEAITDYSTITAKIAQVNKLQPTAPSIADLRDDFKAVTTSDIVLGNCDASNGELTLNAADIAGRIRPGVYNLVYSFTDFDGKPNESIARPFIILAGNGDLDIDGNCDIIKDGDAIENRYKTLLPFALATSDYADARLYKYRMCDVNNDGDVNRADAKYIKQSHTPVKYYIDLPNA